MTGAAAFGAIAEHTVREALRNRMLLLVLAFVVLGLLAALFVSEVAITESQALRGGFLGALLRVASVFTLALFVITSVVREFDDKVVELVLSNAVPRGAYLLGKLAGFSVLCVGIAVACGLALLLVAAPVPVLIWCVSLACELALVAALSLLCLFTFAQVTVALAAVSAFYVLARSIAAFRLMAESPLLPSGGLAKHVTEWTVDGLAFLLPSLERFTRADWLLYGEAGWVDLAPVLAQTTVYVVLLVAAALFDLYRKSF